MPLKNLLYLAQLEEYDVPRIKKWLEDNSGRIVEEKKGKLKWTLKTKILHPFSSLFSVFTSGEKAIVLAIFFLSPIDKFLKFSLVFFAKIKFILFHRNLQVIGITGSWGKTTTKETLFEILKTKFKVRKTEGNNNTLLGVAKTIFKIPKNCEVFICEMAAYQRGEIRSIAKLVNPKIGIITAIGPMHLERFQTLDNIYQTKMELYEEIPKDGMVILPSMLREQILNTRKNIFFFKNEREIYFKAGQYFNIPAQVVQAVLKNPPQVPHRQQIIKGGPVTIIDDTYNSNPSGFKKALKVLAKMQAKRKILVTPGMIELGSLQFQENKKIGEEATGVCDWVIIVGETNKPALLAGLKAKSKLSKAILVKNLEEAKEEMTKLAIPGSAILLENDLPDQYF